MIRTQIYLPEDLHRELKLLAAQQNTNLSQLIREGARQVISNKQKTKKKLDPNKFIGCIKDGPKTDAVKVFHEYYENFS